jgi:hypothetical protein
MNRIQQASASDVAEDRSGGLDPMPSLARPTEFEAFSRQDSTIGVLDV